MKEFLTVLDVLGADLGHLRSSLCEIMCDVNSTNVQYFSDAKQVQKTLDESLIAL